MSRTVIADGQEAGCFNNNKKLSRPAVTDSGICTCMPLPALNIDVYSPTNTQLVPRRGKYYVINTLKRHLMKI
jgi:hypothetical protein